MSELLGADLDAAVARALGLEHKVETYPTNPPQAGAVWLLHDGEIDWLGGSFNPSTNGALAVALQFEHQVAVFPVKRFDNTLTEWVAGFDIDYHTEDRDVVVEHEARGGTPQVAICRAIVQRDKDQKIAKAQEAITAANEAHLEALKSQAWDRATEARRSRVPFTAFANDEEREAYRRAMDSQLDVIQHQNPGQYPPKKLKVVSQIGHLGLVGDLVVKKDDQS